MAQTSSFRIPIAVFVMAGFVFGLFLSFYLGGFLGVPPALFWPSAVIFFLVGVFFLQNPKASLLFLFVYYGFIWNGVFLGRYRVPLPMAQMLDELVLAIPLAIIVMKSIQRDLPRGATFFPLVYVILSMLSAKLNHASMITGFRVMLSYGKFFIYWYFARTIGPWSDKEKLWAFRGLVVFGLLQFFFNLIWQGGPIMRDADIGMGTVGSAHVAAYMSVFSMLSLAGWVLAYFKRTSIEKLMIAGVAFTVMAYNVIFLTDTKHLLLMLPAIVLPYFFISQLNYRLRLLMLAVAVIFGIGSTVYMGMARREGGGFTVSDYLRAMAYSGKGEVLKAIIYKVPHEVPFFYLVGAGPGNFCSAPAVYAFTPLATKYVVPYIITLLRSRGNSSESSVVGNPQTSLHTLLGEFGPLTSALYYWFWGHIIYGLWKRSASGKEITFLQGQQLALLSSLIMIVMLGFLFESFSYGILIMPIWTLVGIFWDDVEKKQHTEGPMGFSAHAKKPDKTKSQRISLV